MADVGPAGQMIEYIQGRPDFLPLSKLICLAGLKANIKTNIRSTVSGLV